MKTINIPKELHTKLKIKASIQGITLLELLTKILKEKL